MAEIMTINVGCRAAVLQYFVDHPNVEITLHELSQELPFGSAQIRSAVNNARRDDTMGASERMEVLVRGNIWRWKSSKNSGKALFEQIAVTKSGGVVVQDESGNLFKLTEI